MDLLKQNMFDLPDQEVVRLYFKCFQKSTVIQRLFPVVDADIFEETITSAYQQPLNSIRYGQASTRACVMAFVAFCARLPHVKNIAKHHPLGQVDYDSLASRSQCLFAQVLQEPATLEGAQAVTMLVSPVYRSSV